MNTRFISSISLLLAVFALSALITEARTINSRIRTLSASKELSEASMNAGVVSISKVKSMQCDFCQAGAEVLKTIGCSAASDLSFEACTAVTAVVCDVAVEICDPICIYGLSTLIKEVCKKAVAKLTSSDISICQTIKLCSKGDGALSSSTTKAIDLAAETVAKVAGAGSDE